MLKKWFPLLFIIILTCSLSIAGDKAKTLESFKHSDFVKKYPQSRPFESSQVRDGSQSNVFEFDLKINPHSKIMLEAVSRGFFIEKYWMLFHSSYLSKMDDFLKDFCLALDPGFKTKEVIGFIKKTASKKNTEGSKNFGQYRVIVKNRMNAVTLSFINLP